MTVDPGRVEGWMASLGIDVAGPLRLERIGLGQSNLTYQVADASGRRWVLRRPPLGDLLASAHDVVREARVMTALADTAVPVPQVLGVLADGEAEAAWVSGVLSDNAVPVSPPGSGVLADAEGEVPPGLGVRSDNAVPVPPPGLGVLAGGEAGVPMVLMSFVDGTVVDRMAVAEALSPALRRSLGLSLVGTLAKIHAVDLRATGLDTLASHKSYAARQLKRWAGQWELSKTREVPSLDELTERLRDAMPEQHEVTLVHGDLHLRNVIASPASGEVVAALDWELCTLGDPLADLGTLHAYWPEAGEARDGEFAPSAEEGFPTRAELAAEYAALTGRSLADLGFWHALGVWKLAIIAEGVMRRALDEPQNKAADGTPTPEAIEALAERASAIAATAGI